jgi:hypothetical protein
MIQIDMIPKIKQTMITGVTNNILLFLMLQAQQVQTVHNFLIIKRENLYCSGIIEVSKLISMLQIKTLGIEINKLLKLKEKKLKKIQEDNQRKLKHRQLT